MGGTGLCTIGMPGVFNGTVYILNLKERDRCHEDLPPQKQHSETRTCLKRKEAPWGITSLFGVKVISVEGHGRCRQLRQTELE